MTATAKAFFCLLLAAPTFLRLPAAETRWTFSSASDRLAADSGPALLAYHDPDATGWAAGSVVFGTASALGLPTLPGGDAEVMAFPACTARQGLLLTHASAPNGPYGESSGLVSNYTVILDLHFPAASDARWRALVQADTNNTNDAEFYVQNVASGGVGMAGNYRGSVRPGTWHRVALVMRAAPGEGQAQRYVDGRFVGAIGTTGSGLDVRYGLGPALLLLTDDNGETAAGHLAGLRFVDRALSPEEVRALGGPHAGGPAIPGAPAPDHPRKMSRKVEPIGHRGGSFDRAPDNTLAAVRAAIAAGVPGIEVDTRFTSDGTVVCFHDATVDRTTNGTGPVSGKTLAELQALDAGSWYDPSFSTEVVPTLDQVLAEASGHLIVYLDMKVYGQAAAISNAVVASGFPPADLWCWTPGSATEAQAIRALNPGVKMLWGGPSADWETNAGYFAGLRALGVAGFSFSSGNGAVDPRFCARAKQEGLFVEIFTILDPDAMLRAADSGVDYVETDSPSTMLELQPDAVTQAAQPFPADGAVDVPLTFVCRWQSAVGATAHQVWLGITPPGDDRGVQTSDLFTPPDLINGTRYFWRVDEITPTGTVTGEVWEFTTVAAPTATQLGGLWLFDRADDPGHATIGNDLVIEGVPPGWSEQLLDDQGNAMRGVITTVAGATNRLRCLHGIAPNGGGAYVNDYSVIVDVLSPPASRSAWRCLLQTNSGNTNDGEYFLRNTDDRAGVSAIGYGTIVPDATWTRLAFTVSLETNATASAMQTHINGGSLVPGGLSHTHTGQPRDGRFALDPALLFFADNDGENAPLSVGMVALFAGTLTAAQVAEFGAAREVGLYPGPALDIRTTNGVVRVTWPPTPGLRLERSGNLRDWLPIPATLNQGEHAEPVESGPAFFQLKAQ